MAAGEGISAVLPSEHEVEAAVHVAALLDDPSSPTVDARESYWRKALGGSFGTSDMELGERLLIATGLVREEDGHLIVSEELRSLLEGSFEALAAAFAARILNRTPAVVEDSDHEERLAQLVPDAERREQLLAALGRRFDDTRRREIGALGEELVLEVARAELRGLGYPELAREVRQVSLESDQLGYDITAPRVRGSKRLLEVKTTTMAVDAGGRVRIHLSRNEADTGEKYERQWAVVICAVDDLEARSGRLVGWLPVGELGSALPSDAERGRWESAEIEVEVDELFPGLPGATG